MWPSTHCFKKLQKEMMWPVTTWSLLGWCRFLATEGAWRWHHDKIWGSPIRDHSLLAPFPLLILGIYCPSHGQHLQSCGRSGSSLIAPLRDKVWVMDGGSGTCLFPGGVRVEAVPFPLLSTPLAFLNFKFSGCYYLQVKHSTLYFTMVILCTTEPDCFLRTRLPKNEVFLFYKGPYLL